MNGSGDSSEVPRQVDEAVERPADPTAPQRTFSRGVGFVMQGLGAALFMLTTCLCCGLAFWEGDAMHRGFVEPSQSVTEAATLLLMTNVLGSLALVAFGLGQQSDRGRVPSVGTAATSTSMCVLYLLIVLTGLMRVDSNAVGWPVIAAAVLAIITLLCSLLTWIAAVQVLRHPPLTSQAPTVPADAFPDPLAKPRQRHESPAQDDIAKRRRKLREELQALDDLERQVNRQNHPDA